MPLIIETGAGSETADSWISEADATAYWSDRSQAEWMAASVPRREVALRNAADYLMFAYRYPGQPTFTFQRLPWPRTGVRSGRGYFPAGAIPQQLIDAQLVLAAEDIRGTALLTRVAAERVVVEESKKLKGLERTLKFATPPVDSVSGLPRFPMVDAILSGIASAKVGSSMASVPLMRGW